MDDLYSSWVLIYGITFVSIYWQARCSLRNLHSVWVSITRWHSFLFADELAVPCAICTACQSQFTRWYSLLFADELAVPCAICTACEYQFTRWHSLLFADELAVPWRNLHRVWVSIYTMTFISICWRARRSMPNSDSLSVSIYTMIYISICWRARRSMRNLHRVLVTIYTMTFIYIFLTSPPFHAQSVQFVSDNLYDDIHFYLLTSSPFPCATWICTGCECQFTRWHSFLFAEELAVSMRNLHRAWVWITGWHSLSICWQACRLHAQCTGCEYFDTLTPMCLFTRLFC